MKLLGTQFKITDHFLERYLERSRGKVWEDLTQSLVNVQVPRKGHYKLLVDDDMFIINDRVLVTYYPNKYRLLGCLVFKEGRKLQ